MILAIRTDQPTAELYLLKSDSAIVSQKNWLADRELAKTLNSHIKLLCQVADIDISDIEGIVVFSGSGSFTGLRIGASVGNAIAYSNGAAIVATRGDDWIKSGVESLKKTKPGSYISPSYDRSPNITKPK